CATVASGSHLYW
nr:immunoglobulin heavy chain junction region [Macaca mulatta]